MLNNFFNQIMHYMEEYILQNNIENIDIKKYQCESPYYNIMNKGHMLLIEGESDVLIHIMLEYEKSIIMKNKKLNNDELLEVIIMEQIIYSIHDGKLYQIAEIVQKFASKNIIDKYVKILEELYISSKEVKDTKSLYLNIPKKNI